MGDKIAREDILKMIEENISSRLANQQATLTFNLQDFDAEKRLKTMLNVDKYIIALYDISEFLRKYLKYDEGERIQYTSSYDKESKEITPDYSTMEYVSDMFYQIMDDNQIDRDELY